MQIITRMDAPQQRLPMQGTPVAASGIGRTQQHQGFTNKVCCLKLLG
jgi:hypothetical protein